MGGAKDMNFIHFEIEAYIQNIYDYTSAHNNIQCTNEQTKILKKIKIKKAVINAHFRSTQVAKLVIVPT